jgi:hypothetical protein
LKWDNTDAVSQIELTARTTKTQAIDLEPGTTYCIRLISKDGGQEPGPVQYNNNRGENASLFVNGQQMFTLMDLPILSFVDTSFRSLAIQIMYLYY